MSTKYAIETEFLLLDHASQALDKIGFSAGILKKTVGLSMLKAQERMEVLGKKALAVSASFAKTAAFMAGNERKRIEGAKRRIIKAFMRGALVLDDDGSLEYTISERSPTGYAGETVRIGGMTGKAWMAMDTCKADEQIHQLMAVASALTGKDVSCFGKLASRDFLVFSNIIALFMSA